MKRIFLLIIFMLSGVEAFAQTDHTLIPVKGDSGVVRGRAPADTNTTLYVYKTLRVKVIKGINDTTLLFPGNVKFSGLVSGISGVTPTKYIDEDVLVGSPVVVNFTGSGVVATLNGDTLDVTVTSGAVDSLTIVNLGFVAGLHTTDTDTQLDSIGIVALGFVAGPHAVDTDTNIDSIGIVNLGFVAGSHTIDTTLDSLAIVALGFVAGAHTIDTDTQLSDPQVETAYNNQVSIVSQAEAEAGLATTVRRWTAQRVAQAIAAIAGGGTDDQVASEVPFTPVGGIIATDVQAALQEVDAEHTIDTDTFVTGKDAHDHNGGDGADIDHANLTNVTTSQHHTKTTSGDDITAGTIAEARIHSSITRDSEIQLKTISAALDSAKALIADTTWFWQNSDPLIGASVTVDSIAVEADTDNFALIFVEKNRGGGGIAVVDTVTASTNGTTSFYITETVMNQSSVEVMHWLGLVRPAIAAKAAAFRIHISW